MKSIYVISDIHLFSKVARPKSFRVFLKQIKNNASKIIILGDLFDSDQFDRPKRQNKKGHIKVLSALRGLVDDRIEVIWVEGNHDYEVIDPFCDLIGAKEISSKDRYELEIAGKKWIFVHGHQFDTFIAEKPILTALATWAYVVIQNIDGHRYSISRWVKKRSKTMLNICKANKDRAISYGKKHDADYVCCGHVHRVGKVCEEGVTYINTGCWVDHPSHYLQIEENGNFYLKEFDMSENDETCEPLHTELQERDLDIQ